MNLIPKEVSALVAHDAGGARVIAAFVASLAALPHLIVADGPAKSILKERFPSVPFSSDLNELRKLNSKSDFVLTGTSYPATLEKEAWRILKELNIRHGAFLDHWVNYWVRFEDKKSLPDEIWVGDEYAFSLAAKEGFPKEKLKLVPNLHFEELKKEISSFQKKDRVFGSQRLLFLCEPISQDARDRLGDEAAFGFTENDIVKNIVKSEPILSKRYSEIVIRPHPLDSPSKFDSLLAEGTLVKKSSEPNYLADIVNSDTVLAIESMGLVIALLANREAVSIIPTNLYKCHLPQKEIRHIKSLKELCE